MSDTIQGARTRNYIKENVPGIQNSGDTLEYATVQEAPGKRGALDAVIHGSFTVSTAHIIEAGSVKRLIKSTAHGAKKGWIMRPSSGASKGEEIAIVNVVDANTFVIAEEFDLALADTFSICRLITPNYTEDGDLNVVITASGPVQFLKDTVITTVEEDTVTPANNEALPTKMFIEIDGVVYPVRKDTSVPANTVSVPVEITGASGPINITAGDLNVQLSDQGPNADVTRIGNGTNRWGINASTEGLVHDADALVQLQAINANTDGLETLIGTSNTSLGSIDTKLSSQATAAKQDLLLAELQLKADLTETQPVSMAAAPVGASLEATQLLVKANTDNLDVALSTRASEATLALIKAKTDNLDVALSTIAKDASVLAGNVLIGAVNEAAPASDTASSGLNGRLQRIAQNISSLITQLPATLGIKTAAASLSVAPASDGVFNTSQTPQGLSTFVTQVVTDAVVSTFTVPAGAKRMVVYNNADASGANRVRRGNVAVPPAWPSTGPILGVGSFTSEIPATTFTVIAEDNSATANVSVEYFY